MKTPCLLWMLVAVVGGGYASYSWNKTFRCGWGESVVILFVGFLGTFAVIGCFVMIGFLFAYLGGITCIE